MKTKNYFKLLFFFLIIVFISCSKDDEKDFTKPENLVGTEWKHIATYESDIDVDYELLKFLSTTIVDFYTKYSEDDAETKEFRGTYVIQGSQITIDSGDGIFTGTIKGVEMIFSIENETFIFTKQ